MKKSVVTIGEDIYSLISEHYASGKQDELPDYAKKVLERWQDADRILMKFPQKSVAARKLIAKYPEISVRQAQNDINDACKFWNLNNPTDKCFLQRFLINHITSSIVNPSVPFAIKAKYAATLERLQSAIGDEQIDPKLMEKNTVNIQFNFNQNNIVFSEQELNTIPLPIRQKLLALTQNTITEAEAVEIINT